MYIYIPLMIYFGLFTIYRLTYILIGANKFHFRDSIIVACHFLY